MDIGPRDIVAEAGPDLSVEPCPLVVSLITCLHEICPGNGAVPHLRQALGQLGLPDPDLIVVGSGRRAPASALAAYLEFLTPELKTQSPGAALSVRWAVYALRGVALNQTGSRVQ